MVCCRFYIIFASQIDWNMEQIGDMMFVDFEEILERDLGKIGTPKRDKFERKVNETVITIFAPQKGT